MQDFAAPVPDGIDNSRSMHHAPNREVAPFRVLNGLGKVRRVPVIAAYVLIQTRVGSAAAVIAALQNMRGVSEPACLTGPYDVIARAQAANIDQLAKFVVARVQSLAGVERTVTCPVIHL